MEPRGPLRGVRDASATGAMEIRHAVGIGRTRRLAGVAVQADKVPGASLRRPGDTATGTIADALGQRVPSTGRGADCACCSVDEAADPGVAGCAMTDVALGAIGRAATAGHTDAVDACGAGRADVAASAAVMRITIDVRLAAVRGIAIAVGVPGEAGLDLALASDADGSPVRQYAHVPACTTIVRVCRQIHAGGAARRGPGRARGARPIDADGAGGAAGRRATGRGADLASCAANAARTGFAGRAACTVAEDTGGALGASARTANHSRTSTGRSPGHMYRLPGSRLQHRWGRRRNRRRSWYTSSPRGSMSRWRIARCR